MKARSALITYMRTDSVRVSSDALEQVRALIPQQYGADYLPEKPNFYKSKKDAQDAHEAIRPTDARGRRIPCGAIWTTTRSSSTS